MRQGLISAMLAFFACGLLAQVAPAQEPRWEPLPPYGECMASAVDHFEQGFLRNQASGLALDWDLVTRDRVDHCGVLAIVTCDRSEAPFACQRELAERQEALRQEILASVPEPEAVEGTDVWSTGLYPTLWEVARGSSAGPDCAGSDEAFEAWCATRQASLKVAEAVSLWQVARLLGVAGPAVELGWVGEPPAPVPTPRPARD